jgi:LemA protein
MKNKKYSGYILGGIVLLFAVFLMVSYNSLVQKDEKVKLQWNEVQNAYQRRLDLIPNLVSTVGGVAQYEQNVLEQITAARSKAVSSSATANNVSAEKFQEQTKAQDELAGAANRLLINVEKYPDIQGTKSFTTLQTQLERTELRIKIARKDFNEAVQAYNSSARNFPVKIAAALFGFKVRSGFSSDAGAEKATEINFK